MNPELFARFVKAVEAGKVEGCTARAYGTVLDCAEVLTLALKFQGVWTLSPVHTDYLCAHLRRWMTEKRGRWDLDPDGLYLYCPDEEIFFWKGSELDRHIEAVLFVLEQGEAGA